MVGAVGREQMLGSRASSPTVVASYALHEPVETHLDEVAGAYLVCMVVDGFSLIEVLDAVAQRIKLHHTVCLDEESVAEVVLQSDPAHVGVMTVLLGADVGIVEIVGLGLVAPWLRSM